EIHIGTINSSAVPLADFFAFPIAGQRSSDLTVTNFIIQLRHTAKCNPLMLIHTQLIRHMQLITVDFLPVKKDDRLKLHTKVFSDPLDDFPRHLTIKVSGQYPGHIRHHGKPPCIGVYRILEDVCRVPILCADVAKRQKVKQILEEYMSTSDGNIFINMAVLHTPEELKKEVSPPVVPEVVHIVNKRFRIRHIHRDGAEYHIIEFMLVDGFQRILRGDDFL